MTTDFQSWRGQGTGLFLCKFHLGDNIPEKRTEYVLDYIRGKLAEYDFLGPQLNRQKREQAITTAAIVAQRITNRFGKRICCLIGDDVIAAISDMYRLEVFLRDFFHGKYKRGEYTAMPTFEPGLGDGRYLCNHHMSQLQVISEEAVFWVVAKLRAKMLSGEFFGGDLTPFKNEHDPAGSIAEKIRERARVPVCCILGEEKMTIMIEDFKREMELLTSNGRTAVSPTVFAGWRQLRKESGNG